LLARIGSANTVISQSSIGGRGHLALWVLKRERIDRDYFLFCCTASSFHLYCDAIQSEFRDDPSEDAAQRSPYAIGGGGIVLLDPRFI
jgi:hypothetical protein